MSAGPNVAEALHQCLDIDVTVQPRQRQPQSLAAFCKVGKLIGCTKMRRRRSSMSQAASHRPASPSMTSTMWLADGMAGSPISTSRRVSRAARS
jgi:hypothetical protein